MRSNILRSICSILLLFAVSGAGAQEETIMYRTRGLRVGYDLSRLALPLVYGGRTGMELSADVDINMNYYAAAEAGFLNVDYEAVSYNYASDGFYFRLGMDHNFLKNISVDQYETVFGGLRIGYASVSHSASDIEILPNYWGSGLLRYANATTVNTVWLEVAGGVKAELFKNIFIGWSFRARLRLHQTRDPVMDPVFVPGFGRGENRTNIGFTYSVFYRIPFMKYVPKSPE